MPKAARQIIAKESTFAFVSAATAWEIAIKRAAGKLRAPGDLEAGFAFEQMVDELAYAANMDPVEALRHE